MYTMDAMITEKPEGQRLIDFETSRGVSRKHMKRRKRQKRHACEVVMRHGDVFHLKSILLTSVQSLCRAL